MLAGDQKKADDDNFGMKFRWDEGLVGGTTDKAFRFHVGGRIDFDSGWYNAPANMQASLQPNPLLDGTDFRRFRLGADGTIWQQVDFKLEADFSRASDFKGFHSTPQTEIFITDAWVAVHDLPVVGTIKVGHQKEYLTFSNATSARFTPFMERPYLFDAYENDFSWDNGVSLSRTYFDDRFYSWAGVFWDDTRSQAFNVGGDYAVTGRLAWTPVYEDGGRTWLNFCASGSLRAVQNDPERITVRPLVRTGESFQVPNLIDTNPTTNPQINQLIYGRDGLQLFGAGAHGACGPLTVGGEYLCRNTPNAFIGGLPGPGGVLPAGVRPAGDLFFDGVYVEVLYFLTPGDYRPLNLKTPGYDRVRPASNFYLLRDGAGGFCHGTGAWEVGARYDHVNVNGGALRAGVNVRVGALDSLTFGVNWYLNPNARLTADYVHTWCDVSSPGAAGQFDALGVRMHFDF
jgi:phosphate-selective porin OprO/OprP